MCSSKLEQNETSFCGRKYKQVAQNGFRDKSQPENGFRITDQQTPYTALPKRALKFCAGRTEHFSWLWGTLAAFFAIDGDSPEGPGSKQRPSARANSLVLEQGIARQHPERTLTRPVLSTAATTNAMTPRTSTMAHTKCSIRQNWQQRCCCSCSSTQLVRWMCDSSAG